MRRRIILNGDTISNGIEIKWEKHPKFGGVYIGDLLTGDCTQNQVSFHLVRIEPGKMIGFHLHENESEIHQVIEGEGKANIDEKNVDYFPGNISFINKNKLHNVIAGENGLLLLSQFLPSV